MAIDQTRIRFSNKTNPTFMTQAIPLLTLSSLFNTAVSEERSGVHRCSYCVRSRSASNDHYTFWQNHLFLPSSLLLPLLGSDRQPLKRLVESGIEFAFNPIIVNLVVSPVISSDISSLSLLKPSPERGQFRPEGRSASASRRSCRWRRSCRPSPRRN